MKNVGKTHYGCGCVQDIRKSRIESQLRKVFHGAVSMNNVFNDNKDFDFDICTDATCCNDDSCREAPSCPVFLRSDHGKVRP